MSTVLQPWVEALPWKQQSILFSGLRGPDHALCPNIKSVNRWIRTVSQNNADPSKDYMAKKPLPSCEDIEKELEHSTCHYVHHFADSLRVVSIGHPDADVRNTAWLYHHYIAEEIFHFVPEDDATFVHRHRDKVEHRL
jgi:hypothetical protein